jgi:hypothetical protein
VEQEIGDRDIIPGRMRRSRKTSTPSPASPGSETRKSRSGARRDFGQDQNFSLARQRGSPTISAHLASHPPLIQHHVDHSGQTSCVSVFADVTELAHSEHSGVPTPADAGRFTRLSPYSIRVGPRVHCCIGTSPNPRRVIPNDTQLILVVHRNHPNWQGPSVRVCEEEIVSTLTFLLSVSLKLSGKASPHHTRRWICSAASGQVQGQVKCSNSPRRK